MEELEQKKIDNLNLSNELIKKQIKEKNRMLLPLLSIILAILTIIIGGLTQWQSNKIALYNSTITLKQRSYAILLSSMNKSIFYAMKIKLASQADLRQWRYSELNLVSDSVYKWQLDEVFRNYYEMELILDTRIREKLLLNICDFVDCGQQTNAIFGSQMSNTFQDSDMYEREKCITSIDSLYSRMEDLNDGTRKLLLVNWGKEL